MSLVSSNHATTLNFVQTPWNFVGEFGIAGNPNKGHSVSSQLDQTEPWQCRYIPSIFASLSHGSYSRSRAGVALGRELQLPMSFPWPVFPGLDQALFPPMVFLVFWDSIPKRCRGPLIGLSFSSFLLFSGLFWPGPFSPFFDYGFQNGAKECIV